MTVYLTVSYRNYYVHVTYLAKEAEIIAKSTKINVMRCPECGDESVESRYCYQCRSYREMTSRDKVRVTSTYKVVDWFSSRSSAGLIVEGGDGERYPIYMSDVFRHLDGLNLGELTLEETKKGSAYGWCVVKGGGDNHEN